MESNANAWKDNEVRRVIDKKTLNKMAWRSMFLQASFNYERMQACGWLYGLLPGLKKIHTNDDDLAKSMTAHMEFFNTHPFLVTIIMGVIISMEEAKESPDAIRGIKVGMMGPLGGIGDALLWMTALPIAGAIGVGMILPQGDGGAAEPSILGPIVFLLIFNAIHFGLRFGLMHYGYKLGVQSVGMLKENTKLISRAATIIGLTIVGALIASYIGISVQWIPEVKGTQIPIQEILDSILPKMLPLIYAWVMYYLVKKGNSPLKLVFVTILVGLVLTGLPMLITSLMGWDAEALLRIL